MSRSMYLMRRLVLSLVLFMLLAVTTFSLLLFAGYYLTLGVNLNWLRPPICSWLSQQFARELLLRGSILLRLENGKATLQVSNPWLANIPGTSWGELFEARELLIKFTLPHSLQIPEVAQIELIDPVFHLERSASGVGNWNLAPDSGDSDSESPSLASGAFRSSVLVIKNGIATFQNRVARLKSSLELPAVPQVLSVRSSGWVRSVPVGATVQISDPLALLRGAQSELSGRFVWQQRTPINVRGYLKLLHPGLALRALHADSGAYYITGELAGHFLNDPDGAWLGLTVRGNGAALGWLTLSEIKLDAKVLNESLRFERLTFSTAGGRVQVKADLDLSFWPPRLEWIAGLRDLELRQLLPSTAASDLGKLNGWMQLSSRGDDPLEIVNNMDGQAFLALKSGKIDSLLMALLRLDIADTLTSLLFRQVALRCAATHIWSKGSILNLDPLVIDTSDTKVTGGGIIDLPREHFNLTLEPNPKDISIFSMHSPLRITGSFNYPEVRPKIGQLGGRVAVAAALGTLIGPMGVVLSMVEPGIGEDSECRNLTDSWLTKNPLPFR